MSQTQFVFVMSKPGNDLDGEEASFVAESREHADAQAAERGRVLRATLTLVGLKRGGVFAPVVPFADLPWWAQEWIEQARERATVKRRPVRNARPKDIAIVRRRCA